MQLYVRDVKSTVSRPLKELKSFAKVELAPGESKTVSFRLGKRAFSYYNVDMRDWHVESGVFEIMAARSSQDVVLIETVEVESTITLVTTFGRNSTIGDLLEHPATAQAAMKMLQAFNENSGMGDALQDAPEMAAAMMRYLPLRALVAFSGGEFSEETMDAMLANFNSMTA